MSIEPPAMPYDFSDLEPAMSLVSWEFANSVLAELAMAAEVRTPRAAAPAALDNGRVSAP